MGVYVIFVSVCTHLRWFHNTWIFLAIQTHLKNGAVKLFDKKYLDDRYRWIFLSYTVKLDRLFWFGIISTMSFMHLGATN